MGGLPPKSPGGGLFLIFTLLGKHRGLPLLCAFVPFFTGDPDNPAKIAKHLGRADCKSLSDLSRRSASSEIAGRNIFGFDRDFLKNHARIDHPEFQYMCAGSAYSVFGHGSVYIVTDSFLPKRV